MRTTLARVARPSMQWSRPPCAKPFTAGCRQPLPDLAACRRPTTRQMAKIRQFHGQHRTRRVGQHELPGTSPGQAAQPQSDKKAEQRCEATGGRSRHLPQRTVHHLTCRGHIAGAKRRAAVAKPLHAGQGHGRTQFPTQRGAASPNSIKGSLTDCRLKHAGIFTTSTDVTFC